MVSQELLGKYVDIQKKLLHEHGLIHFRNGVLIQEFDDASDALERPKIFKKADEAWLRLKPNGEINVESSVLPLFIDDKTAMAYHKMMGIPLHHIDSTDLYNTELEAVQMENPVIVVPDKIDTNGAAIPYSISPVEGFIIETLSRFAPEGKASETEIIDFLTDPYPNGGNWYKRTPNFILNVKHLLERLTYQGKIELDEKTQKYSLVHKASTSKVK